MVVLTHAGEPQLCCRSRASHILWYGRTALPSNFEKDKRPINKSGRTTQQIAIELKVEH